MGAAGWAVVAVAAVVLVGLAARGRAGPAGAASSADRRGAPQADDIEPTTTTTRSPSTTSSVPPCVVGTRVPSQQEPSGGRCPHEVTVDGGGSVVVDGRRVRVGRPGDEVLVADWGCAGVRPAVRRTATGEVLVYGPIDGAAPPVVAQAERLAEAEGLAAELDNDGCPALLVITPEGTIRLT